MNRTSLPASDKFFPAYRIAFAAFLLGAFLGSLGVALVVLPAFVTGDLLLLTLATPFALLGLLIFLGSMVVCFHSIGSLRARVQVYADSAVVKRMWSSRKFHWDQIVSVQYNGRNGHQDLPTTSCYLLLQDGTRHCLPHVWASDRLVRIIEEETSARLLPQVLDKYYSGGTIDFGRIKLSTQGVTKGAVLRPWDEIESIFFDDDGWLSFQCRGIEWRQWIVVSPNKVDNHILLARLLEAVGKPMSSASAS